MDKRYNGNNGISVQLIVSKIEQELNNRFTQPKKDRKVKKIMRNETIGCISPISHRLIRAEQASPVCGRSENREQDLFFEWEM